VASKLISGLLKRNFPFFPVPIWLAPTAETEGTLLGLVLAHGRFNSKRGMNCRICEKILLTRVKAAEPP
jgi:hypothetical protein